MGSDEPIVVREDWLKEVKRIAMRSKKADGSFDAVIALAYTVLSAR